MCGGGLRASSSTTDSEPRRTPYTEHGCASLRDTAHGTCSGCVNSNMPSLFCRLDLTVLPHFLHVPGGNVCLLHVRDAAHAEPLHAQVPGPCVSTGYVPPPARPRAPLLAPAQQSATKMVWQDLRVKPCWGCTLNQPSIPLEVVSLTSGH